MSDLWKKRKDRFAALKMVWENARKYGAYDKHTAISSARIKPEDEEVHECASCHSAFSKRLIRENYYTCPKCGHLYTIPPEKRIQLITDENTFIEFEIDDVVRNPIDFPEYEGKINEIRAKTGYSEAIYAGHGKIGGSDAVIAVMNSRFMMGSMGVYVGEMIARSFEYAGEHEIPCIIFCASGGARMQEGMFSLMQMAKTSAAAEEFKKNGGLYISYLTHPTTGGVSASFASLGDITLAERHALIGFAGPRVIEQTIGQKLPKGFQRSEYLLDHGFIDEIVDRKDMRSTLIRILRMHGYGTKDIVKVDSERADSESAGREITESEMHNASLSADERVEIARDPNRPKIEDYIENVFDDFFECRGDRLGREDRSICGGIAMLGETPVTVIAHRKGNDLDANLSCNLGMPGPEGYRKSYRLMTEAEKFGRPVITFVDTPGAYPGIEAEMFGQSQAIAENLALMSRLKVPVITFITGEGNSGGALAIAVADKVYMFENSVYSILSPEGFCSIMWKDTKRKKEACSMMKCSASDLLSYGIVDGVLPEHEGGMTEDPRAAFDEVKQVIIRDLRSYSDKSGDEIARQRRERYRKIGSF